MVTRHAQVGRHRHQGDTSRLTDFSVPDTFTTRSGCLNALKLRHHRRSGIVRIELKFVMPVLAAGMVAAGIAAAPSAAADNSEFCTGLTTSSTKCEKQGNVEINDSLARTNSLPIWVADAGATGGPYGGTLGGGPR
jgi:hypothetical protein